MDIKPVLVLAMALFLVSAPDPDSRAIAEMTANFIVPSDERALQAAEPVERREETPIEVELETDQETPEPGPAPEGGPQATS